MQSVLNNSTSMGPTTTTNLSSVGDDTDSVVSDVTFDQRTSCDRQQLQPVINASRGISDILLRRPRKPSWGNDSVTSHCSSTAGTATTKRTIARKALLNNSQLGYNGGSIQGRNLLSGDMLDYLPEENIDSVTADALKISSQGDPCVLLGWQVRNISLFQLSFYKIIYYTSFCMLLYFIV